MNTLYYQDKFICEKGDQLPELEIAYHTWGRLNKTADNVIWVCHALTANSDVSQWWPGTIGDGKMLDTSKYYIVCANILGSCYGTSGPLSLNPASGTPWYHSFPELTTRDQVRAHEILRKHLGIKEIHTIIGASIGGHQALEYSVMYPDLVKRMVFIASNAKQSPWAIAFNESQRLALEADPTFYSKRFGGGEKGLKAARSIALLSYRNNLTYNSTQAEEDENKTGSFRAGSYQDYQGTKLVRRFNAWSYYRLTQVSDSFNIGRLRGGVEKALSAVKAKTLVIGITSDILFPPADQKRVAEGIKGARLELIESFYGHDGFLIETKTISPLIKSFISDNGAMLSSGPGLKNKGRTMQSKLHK